MFSDGERFTVEETSMSSLLDIYYAHLEPPVKPEVAEPCFYLEHVGHPHLGYKESNVWWMTDKHGLWMASRHDFVECGSQKLEPELD
ncbi:hypothetical protein GQ457_01G051660 [Hibiscus cannabinus]